MDARLGEQQLLLQRSARDFLARECPIAYVRRMMEDPTGTTDAFWHQLVELGWTGLVVPEAAGGVGLGWLDLAVVLEEAGAALLPGPFFSSLVLGAGAIAAAGDTAQHERLLPPLARGERRATLALGEPGGGAVGPIALCARRAPGGYRLTGRKAFVPDGAHADEIVVAARQDDADGPLLLARISGDADGVRARPVAFTDATRKLAEIELQDVFVPDEDVLGREGDAEVALSRVLDRARVALVAEMTGIAARVLELSVEFARTRKQFGRPIGSFQAVQHKCADMLLHVENLRSATWAAAWALDQDEAGAHEAACMAKAYASSACSAVAAEGIQIHGGLGYTWEQDLHLYYKRAKADEAALGDGSEHRERVAALLLDDAHNAPTPG